MATLPTDNIPVGRVDVLCPVKDCRTVIHLPVVAHLRHTESPNVMRVSAELDEGNAWEHSRWHLDKEFLS